MSWKRAPAKKRGIICGADRLQEWLLPWWWSRYEEHNQLPVLFIDFGMTDEMRFWCQERGEVITMDPDLSLITPRSAIDDTVAKEWEERFSWRVWNARRAWFTKPLALLESPFEEALWIDLDCEILGPLDALFSAFDPSAQLGIVREYRFANLPVLDPKILYNGGVVIFQHGSKIIEKWAQGAITQNHLFAGDDCLLSHLIHASQLKVQELPQIYNWRMRCGLNLNAVIVHWVGNPGKDYIQKYGGLKPSLDDFYHSCKGKL
jgi:hypothetical protein